MTRERSVTKSIRLSPHESALLAEVRGREHLAEGTLLRKWVEECRQAASAFYSFAFIRSILNPWTAPQFGWYQHQPHRCFPGHQLLH